MAEHDFIAQGIVIDVCKLLGGQDSVFLQQASHLTGGVYFRLDGSAGLLQTLVVSKRLYFFTWGCSDPSPTRLHFYHHPRCGVRFAYRPTMTSTFVRHAFATVG